MKESIAFEFNITLLSQKKIIIIIIKVQHNPYHTCHSFILRSKSWYGELKNNTSDAVDMMPCVSFHSDVKEVTFID